MPNWSAPRKSLRRARVRISPRLRGTLALSVPIFCTVTIFTAWISTRLAVRQARSWVDHTEDVIYRSNKIHLRLTRIESELRRHTITNTTQSPQQYIDDKNNVIQLAETVYQLVDDNPSQQQTWAVIQTLINERFTYLSQVLDMLPQRSISDVQARDILTQGQGVMRELRTTLNAFQEEERRLLAHRENQLEALLTISMMAGWGLLFGSLISSGAAVYLFRGLDSAHESQGAELQQSQQLMEAIAASVVDGVVSINPNGTIAQLNRSARQMFGYDSPSSYPPNIVDLLKTPLTEVLSSDAQDKTSHRIFETEGFRHDGSVFPIEVSVSKISVNQQQFLIIRDISERLANQENLEKYAEDLKNLNDILSFSNQALTQRNEELDQFAYLASHDLKAPLRAITNLSTWIEEDMETQLTPESERLFELLRGRAVRLEKLIDALAYYSQIGQQPIELEPVDVKTLVKESIENQDSSDRFTFMVSPHLPIIQANAKYLAVVFSQLIENAIQFHPADTGIIRIEVNELETGWQFSVIDDGAGIEPQYHKRIFEVFQTLNARDQVESTGIGLAIVTKILQTVNGSINVKSKPGEGSNFQFIWPK